MLNNYKVYAYVNHKVYKLTDDLRFKDFSFPYDCIWENVELSRILEVLNKDSEKHGYLYSVYTLDDKYVGGNK